MSIKTIQEKNVEKDFIESYLKKGIYPSEVEINLSLSEFKLTHVLGMPQFIPYFPSHGDISNRRLYNQAFKTLEIDLKITFQNIIYESNRIEVLNSYYENEKNKIQLDIEELRKEIEIIETYIANKDAQEIYYESFYNFKNVEMKENKNRNIYKTDAFVDLKGGFVCLPSLYYKSYRKELVDADITLERKSNFIYSYALNPIEHILTENINENWYQECISEQEGLGAIEISIELQKQIEGTSISIELNSPSNTRCYLYVGFDKDNLKELESYESNEKVKWVFENQVVKYIKIRMEKAKSDMSIGNKFYYYFGAKKLSLVKETYKNEAKFISKPLIVNKKYKEIILKTSEAINIDTEIEYYISRNSDEYEENPKNIQWIKINKNEPLKIKDFEIINEIYDKETENYGELYKEEMGRKVYKIGEIEENAIQNIKLKYGINMWKIERVLNNSIKSADYSAWKEVINPSINLLKYEYIYEPNFFETREEEIGRMTIYIEVEKAGLFNLLIKELTSASNFKIGVYVNQIQIKEVNNKFNIFVKEGINKIEVFYYSQNASHISIKFDDVASLGILKFSSDKEEMKRVNLHDLIYNTKDNDINYYSIDGLNVIVNFNPFEKDIKEEEILFEVYSEKLIKQDEFPEYIRLMAILSSKNKSRSITPFLKDYLIITK